MTSTARKPTPRRRAARSAGPSQISPEAYVAFVGQIELRAIWLEASRVTNHRGPKTPELGAAINITSNEQWEAVASGFRVHHRTTIELEALGTLLAEVEVTLGLDFESKEPMSDALFEVFKVVNLPLNTWPFVREYLSTTMGRMNWMPFTLPALKRGTGETAARSASSPVSADPRRSARGGQNRRPTSGG